MNCEFDTSARVSTGSHVAHVIRGVLKRRQHDWLTLIFWLDILAAKWENARVEGDMRRLAAAAGFEEKRIAELNRVEGETREGKACKDERRALIITNRKKAERALT